MTCLEVDWCVDIVVSCFCRADDGTWYKCRWTHPICCAGPVLPDCVILPPFCVCTYQAPADPFPIFYTSNNCNSGPHMPGECEDPNDPGE